VPAGIVTVTFATKVIGPVADALVLEEKVTFDEIVWLLIYKAEVFCPDPSGYVTPFDPSIMTAITTPY